MKTSKRDARIATITHDEMHEALADLLYEMGTDAILAIPGVYEAVSEALNNEAIDLILGENDEEDDEDEEDELGAQARREGQEVLACGGNK